jgi:hypothetical protein
VVQGLACNSQSSWRVVLTTREHQQAPMWCLRSSQSLEHLPQSSCHYHVGSGGQGLGRDKGSRRIRTERKAGETKWPS